MPKLLLLLMVTALTLGACSEPPREVVRPAVTPADGWWDTARWQAFLQGWSAEAIALLRASPPGRLHGKMAEALKRGTLMAPPAPEPEIAALEVRVGRPLPPSYKAFLRASGGWLQLALDVDDSHVWEPKRVAWFRDQEAEWLKAWTSGWGQTYEASDDKYFVYGAGQDTVQMRPSYLHHALAISEGVEAAVYLLNPLVRDDRGEWEAWFFGKALPGAQRYRSFQELMAAERPRTLAGLRVAVRPR
jgi:hypothetical protein